MSHVRASARIGFGQSSVTLGIKNHGLYAKTIDKNSKPDS